LPELRPSEKGEFYLTDLMEFAVTGGGRVECVRIHEVNEVIGVNTRQNLAQAEAALRDRICTHWMREGVTFQDPATAYIGPDVYIGRDTRLLANTHLEGETVVGSACEIGPNTIIRDSKIGDLCQIEASVVEGAVLENHVNVGPFSHLRSGAYLCEGVHLGNFGEVKNSKLGPGVKAGHFCYLGDAEIASNVNIGAGTITCNYDGKRKNKTIIGEEAFIGSDTMLVAPVTIGKGARTGAGAVVTRDIPDYMTAVGMPARVIRRLKAKDE
jgi:bifunctional UDP-N-acetylglucosamine pyrophosphorylase/glucosamine-1-phosphate N-acetyltransferase